MPWHRHSCPSWVCSQTTGLLGQPFLAPIPAVARLLGRPLPIASMVQLSAGDDASRPRHPAHSPRSRPASAVLLGDFTHPATPLASKPLITLAASFGIRDARS